MHVKFVAFSDKRTLSLNQTMTPLIATPGDFSNACMSILSHDKVACLFAGAYTCGRHQLISQSRSDRIRSDQACHQQPWDRMGERPCKCEHGASNHDAGEAAIKCTQTSFSSAYQGEPATAEINPPSTLHRGDSKCQTFKRCS